MSKFENWTLLNHGTWSQLYGQLYDDNRCVDGTWVTTSYLRVFTDGKASTLNTTYILGAPAGIKLCPQTKDEILKERLL